MFEKYDECLSILQIDSRKAKESIRRSEEPKTVYDWKLSWSLDLCSFEWDAKGYTKSPKYTDIVMQSWNSLCIFTW